MPIRTTKKRTNIAGTWSTMTAYRSTLDSGHTGLNYWGDGSDGSTTILTNTTWDSTSSGDMIVKNFVNLTIYGGTTLTIKARKGALIYVSGNFVNNGTIVVNTGGYAADPSIEAVPSTGIRIIRRKSGATDTLSASDLAGCGAVAIASEAGQTSIAGNGKIYTIARAGATGGAVPAQYTIGNNGADGVTGGGGSGGGGGSSAYNAGAGGVGNCWSGGPGGGGSTFGYGSVAATDGSLTGGVGGLGGSSSNSTGGGGGAGNPGGNGGNSASAGESKAGGLAVFFVRGNLTNTGTIQANGGIGGSGASDSGGGSSGGGSGGGRIMALYAGALSNSGTIQALGGVGGSVSNSSAKVGGTGGAGSTLIEQIDV